MARGVSGAVLLQVTEYASKDSLTSLESHRRNLEVDSCWSELSDALRVLLCHSQCVEAKFWIQMLTLAELYDQEQHFRAAISSSVNVEIMIIPLRSQIILTCLRQQEGYCPNYSFYYESKNFHSIPAAAFPGVSGRTGLHGYPMNTAKKARNRIVGFSAQIHHNHLNKAGLLLARKRGKWILDSQRAMSVTSYLWEHNLQWKKWVQGNI